MSLNAAVIVGIVVMGLLARAAIHRSLTAVGLVRAAERVKNPNNTQEFYGLLFLVLLGALAIVAWVQS